MVTIKIDEDTFLDMLMDRVEYWTDDYYTQDLFRDYYKRGIDCNCFEGCQLDLNFIVDNDYINNLRIISKEDFKQYDIEDNTDDRIQASNEERGLYLITAY